jgi:hypothetical protein
MLPPSVSFENEKAELDAVLASGIFNRAPNLASLLNYVCSRYFEGYGDQIKEYNIAVEALGRSPEFDQKVDSIVRVEAHRLRKRLRDYYQTEGAAHSVRIDIPPGQYAPRFTHGQAAESMSVPEVSRPAVPLPEAHVLPAALPQPAAMEVIAPPVVEQDPGRHNVWFWFAAAAALLLAVSLPWGIWSVRASRMPPRSGRAPAIAPTPSYPIAAAIGSSSLRILCGWTGGEYVDRSGNAWQNDQYFQGGTVFDTINHPIVGARDPRLYNIRREGAFHYDIPLKPGVYELRLHFAETVYGENNAAGGGETSRVFNVFINDRKALDEFDVVEDAGASTADIRVFKDVSPAADGELHLRFEAHSNLPILSGIEIQPGTPRHLRPIRLVAQDRAYRDKDGNVWEPDRYARGGLLVTRGDVIKETPDPDIYRGERFGNITYVIPVAQGRYSVTLHFAETWFGPKQAAGGGIGSRVFDILCNGVAVKRNFDIFREAGGADRAVTTTIHDVEANHQGKLVVSLVPVTNYACVNAIEIADETR